MLFFHILSSPPYLLLPFQLVLWQEEVAEAIEERAVGIAVLKSGAKASPSSPPANLANS